MLAAIGQPSPTFMPYWKRVYQRGTTPRAAVIDDLSGRVSREHQEVLMRMEQEQNEVSQP